MRKLNDLLNFENYLKLINNIIDNKVASVSFDSYLEYFGGDREKFRRVLISLIKKLRQINKEIVYPLEVIPIPRYPFTKVPMLKWGNLQNADYGSEEVTALKTICGKLGKLINTGFLLRKFILIDIDCKDLEYYSFLESICDIKTRRGYHIIRFLPSYEALNFKLGTQEGGRIVIAKKGISIELFSGGSFLGSYPLQSRYLEFREGKLHVRAYKILSNELKIAMDSADLTPISSSIDDIYEILEVLLTELDLKGYLKNLSITPKSKEDSTAVSTSKPHLESRFNRNPLLVLQPFTYSDFRDLLLKLIPKLPVCFRVALFGNPPKGSRYYHLRLLVSILPFFVRFNREDLLELAEDCKQRYDLRRAKEYYYHYFTGKATLSGTQIILPSLFGVPHEAWSIFSELGYCKRCPLQESCGKLPSSKKRRWIVQYIANLVWELCGGENKVEEEDLK